MRRSKVVGSSPTPATNNQQTKKPPVVTRGSYLSLGGRLYLPRPLRPAELGFRNNPGKKRQSYLEPKSFGNRLLPKIHGDERN